MTTPLRALLCTGAFAALLCAPPAARCGELDLTGSLSSFTSPNGVGPWRFLTFTDNEVVGADKPGIAVVDRSDDDLGDPGHSFGVVLDDYHDWSSRWFTFAAVGTASGSILPTRNGYVEGDLKFGPALATVFAAGGGVNVNPDGTVQRYFNVGPTWYHNNMNVTLRWLPSFTAGRAGSSSGLFTLANGAAGTTVTTLTLLGGNEPPYGVVSVVTSVETGERVLFAGIDVKHWVDRKEGYEVGIELEQLTDSTSGNLLYVRRGLNVGVFREIGRGPAP
jgi:YaiO family outer membrane protein